MTDKTVQLEISEKSVDRRPIAYRPMGHAPVELSFADQAERSIQILSRWAGIFAFAAALAALAYALI